MRTVKTGREGRRTLALLLAGSLVTVVTACSGEPGSPAPTSGPDSSGGAPTSPASSPTSSTSPSPTSPGPAPASATVIEISVRGKVVSPPPGRTKLARGERVHLVLRVDRDNEVHIHGAEIERKLTAGTAFTADFTIKQAGIYPIELHEPELLLRQLVVR